MATPGISAKIMKQIREIEAGSLSPTSVTWKTMQLGKYLPRFENFLIDIQRKKSNFDDSGPAVHGLQELNECLKQCIVMNEGYATVKATLIAANIVSLLNKEVKSTVYRYEVYATVLEDVDDSRRNKHADCSIVKITNARTVCIMEMKLAVSELNLNASDEDGLAQLFLETIYLYRKECKIFNKLLCIYGNFTVFHAFIVNIVDGSNITLQVEKYYYMNLQDFSMYVIV